MILLLFFDYFIALTLNIHEQFPAILFINVGYWICQLLHGGSKAVAKENNLNNYIKIYEYAYTIYSSNGLEFIIFQQHV